MAKTRYLYVGNMGADKKAGITILQWDENQCRFHVLKTVFPNICASRIITDKERQLLFCVDEKVEGRIYSFKISSETGDLLMINWVDTHTALPCYLSFDAKKTHILVSNYACRRAMEEGVYPENHEKECSEQLYAAAIISYPISKDGELGEAVHMWKPQVCKHEQKDSHLHSVVKAPGKDWFVACDLGTDKVYSMKVSAGMLQIVDIAEMPDKGVQPRYSCFHPGLPLVYINGENTNKIYTYRYTEEGILSYDGEAELAGNRTDCKQSDIIMNSKGTLLIALARNENMVSLFDVSAAGKLLLKQTISLGKYKPKGVFFLEESGVLLVACPQNQKILQFEFDGNKISEVPNEDTIICPQCIIG